MAFFKPTLWKFLWTLLIFIVLFYIESYTLSYMGLSCNSMGLPHIVGQPAPPSPTLSPQCIFYNEVLKLNVVLLLLLTVLAYTLSCTAIKLHSGSPKSK